MAHKHLKTSAMAAIVLGCALGVAQAATPSPLPIDPSQLRTLLKLEPGVPIPPTGGLRVNSTASIVTGFNFFVCSQSSSFTNGTVFFVFASNKDGSLFFATSTSADQTSFQAQLLAACQHAGGGYFLNITNLTTFAFNDIAISYP